MLMNVSVMATVHVIAVILFYMGYIIVVNGALELQRPLYGTNLDPDAIQNASQPLGNDGAKPIELRLQNSSNTCPSTPCYCDSRLKTAWCSNLELTAIPVNLPTDIKHIHLEHNSLQAIEQEDLRHFPDLKSLNVSHNNIGTIAPRAFSDNSQLDIIDLKYNRLGGDSGLVFLCSMPNAISHLDLAGNGIHRDNLYLLTLCSTDSLTTLDISHNNLSGLPVGFLAVFPNLQTLSLDGNQLTEIPEGFTENTHPLVELRLSHNDIIAINCSAFQSLTSLEELDLSYNSIDRLPAGMCSEYLHSLSRLSVDGNSFNALSQRAFENLTSLTTLQMSHSSNLSYLSKKNLAGLSNLTHLDLSHSPRLEFIHAEALNSLTSLQELDLSYCKVSWLHEDVFNGTKSLRGVSLAGNPWHCDCDLKWLSTWHGQQTGTALPHSVICTSPPTLAGLDLFNSSVSSSLQCQGPVIVKHNVTLWLRLGTQAVLDCEATGSPRARVTWITSKHQVLEYHPAYPDTSGPDFKGNVYHDDHSWHDSTSYAVNQQYPERITVLRNGSLFIDYVTRRDAGNYTCMASNGYGNHSAVILVRLDSSILQWVKVYSMLVGLTSALAFFFLTVSITSIRYYAIKCSTKERLKKNSIREVLESLHDFKTVQIDRFCAYKTAKISKLSAYKSDKMHKLVAFKTAKVGKLMTYKQVTMASIFHHIEKMKEHYHSQMDKVKDNCSQQVEKLRENYCNHVGKFKDYRQEKIERIRENYNTQVLKVRDYRSSQMDKLRDQYKLQQQHLFKLMELLDIGNCLNVVEAECMRTESMLFDPNISFDLEAQPVHVQRDMDLSDESEYMTAGSQSDQSDVDDTAYPAKYTCEGGPSAGSSAHETVAQPTTTKYRQKTKSKRKKHRASQSKSRPGHRHQPSDSSASFCESLSDAKYLPSDGPSAEPPPPPNFTCDIPDLNDRPLEDIVAGSLGTGVDLDRLSLYQTPPSSAELDLEASHRPHSHTKGTENIGMQYLGADQSHRELQQDTSTAHKSAAPGKSSDMGQMPQQMPTAAEEHNPDCRNDNGLAAPEVVIDCTESTRTPDQTTSIQMDGFTVV